MGRALTEERGCEEVVRTIAAARGAINALAAEVRCDHSRVRLDGLLNHYDRTAA